MHKINEIAACIARTSIASVMQTAAATHTSTGLRAPAAFAAATAAATTLPVSKFDVF